MTCPYLRTFLTARSATLRETNITSARNTCVSRRTAGETLGHTISSPKCRRVARDNNPDLDIPMNAAPKENEQTIPDTLTKYFTLDKNRNTVGVSCHQCQVWVAANLLPCRESFTARRMSTRRASGRLKITSLSLELNIPLAALSSVLDMLSHTYIILYMYVTTSASEIINVFNVL